MLTLAISVYLLLFGLVILFFVARYRANTRRTRELRAIRHAYRADPNQDAAQFGFAHSATH